MTPDQYVESVLAKYRVPRGPTSPAEQLGGIVAGPLRTWAGQQPNALEYSGSYAKETGVRGISDVDVFISLKADTTNTLRGGSLPTVRQSEDLRPGGTSGPSLPPGPAERSPSLPRESARLPAGRGTPSSSRP